MVTLCACVLFFPLYLYITLRKSSSKCLCYESEVTKVLLSVRSSEKDSRYHFNCTAHEVSDGITPGITANKMGNGECMEMTGSELFMPMSYDH